MILGRHSANFMPHMLNNEKILFRVIFLNSRRKLVKMQNNCKLASFLAIIRKLPPKQLISNFVICVFAHNIMCNIICKMRYNKTMVIDWLYSRKWNEKGRE